MTLISRLDGLKWFWNSNREIFSIEDCTGFHQSLTDNWVEESGWECCGFDERSSSASNEDGKVKHLPPVIIRYHVSIVVILNIWFGQYNYYYLIHHILTITSRSSSSLQPNQQMNNWVMKQTNMENGWIIASDCFPLAQLVRLM